MKDILLKSAAVTILATILAAPAMAGANDWLSDPAVETMWSSGITLNNVDLGTSFQIDSVDPIPYGSQWAYGYDRVATVKATASLIRPYFIYRDVYDNNHGD